MLLRILGISLMALSVMMIAPIESGMANGVRNAIVIIIDISENGSMTERGFFEAVGQYIANQISNLNSRDTVRYKVFGYNQTQEFPFSDHWHLSALIPPNDVAWFIGNNIASIPYQLESGEISPTPLEQISEWVRRMLRSHPCEITGSTVIIVSNRILMEPRVISVMLGLMDEDEETELEADETFSFEGCDITIIGNLSDTDTNGSFREGSLREAWERWVVMQGIGAKLLLYNSQAIH